MSGFAKGSSVKLVSDGTISGTRVVHVDEDGAEKEISRVAFAEWKLDCNSGIPVLKLTILASQADVVVPVGGAEIEEAGRND